MAQPRDIQNEAGSCYWTGLNEFSNCIGCKGSQNEAEKRDCRYAQKNTDGFTIRTGPETYVPFTELIRRGNPTREAIEK